MESLYLQALQLTPHRQGVLEEGDSQHWGCVGDLMDPCPTPVSVLALS